MPDLGFQRKVRRLAIVAMFSDDYLMERLVLKGGTLLEFAYEISSRSSFDIDFSIATSFDDLGEVERRVEVALQSVFLEESLHSFDVKITPRPPDDVLTDDLREIWGGYTVNFKLIDAAKHRVFGNDREQLRRNAMPVNGSRATFEIDISRHEFCTSTRSFILDGVTVTGYSPELFVCEKLRAICQQMPEYHAIVRRQRETDSGRARDFFDIYEVMHRLQPQDRVDFSAAPFQELLRTVFGAKLTPLVLIAKIGDYRELHRSDFASVRDTVAPGVHLLEFDDYVDFLVRECKKLEPLWDEQPP